MFFRYPDLLMPKTVFKSSESINDEEVINDANCYSKTVISYFKLSVWELAIKTFIANSDVHTR